MRKSATRRSPSQYKKPITPTPNFWRSIWPAVQSPWVMTLLTKVDVFSQQGSEVRCAKF